MMKTDEREGLKEAVATRLGATSTEAGREGVIIDSLTSCGFGVKGKGPLALNHEVIQWSGMG